MKKYKPVVLVIMDGLGVPQEEMRSPVGNIKTRVFKEMGKNFPFTTLQASGIAVGLPWGKAGNSEVGHMTIGAGKIIHNYLPKISTAISDKTFFQNKAFLSSVGHVHKNNSVLHFVGLFSTGTVHAYFEHLYALLELARQQQVPAVFLHLFTDGKDAYKKESAEWLRGLEDKIKSDYPNATIASVIGRNFAMNRDSNLEKTQKTFDLLVNGVGNNFESASDYINQEYQKGIYDDAIEPAKNVQLPMSNIKTDDAVIFFNFREDSMRQLVKKFLDEKINDLLIVTMTEYDKNFNCLHAFESAKVENPLAKIISENGLTQLHISESEKYAHITYFLNGGRELPFEKEDRILVPSPETSSYEFLPEMSSQKITDAVIKNINSYDFIAINFANADMVGHTGNFEATTQAIDAIGDCVTRLMNAILETEGALLITADHGNAEEKIYKITGKKKSEHSTNPVPFYLVAKEFKNKKPLSGTEIQKQKKQVSGTLTDIAPTILELLNITKPPEMTGGSLIGKIT